MSGKCEQCGIPLGASGDCQSCLLKLGMSQSREPTPPLAELPSSSALNEQFPQLEITRLIGRGGMGAIYHARQTALDRDVALKVIAREVAGDSTFIERFEREAKTLAKLSHPNIVTIYDFGRTPDGQAYLIMEYVDGINLREAISSGSVGSEDALDVVCTICKALEYAHSKGIVHRDIKPENILLGEDGTLKVADFGIAKIIDDSIRTPTLTATRQVLGSLHYLAPEHLESPDQVDHRIDLYALGVVFYELLAGQLPLGRYDPPSSVNHQLDKRIDAISMKSLSRKPSLRYQKAADLRKDLEELRSSGSVDSLPFVEPIEAEKTASVPFTCEAMGGFAEAVGIVHATGSTVTIEYRVRDAIWGTVKTNTQVVEIPLHRLARVDLYPGVFSAKLVLMTDKISTLEKFPNAETGRVQLKIKRGDLELAEDLVEIVGRGSSASVPARFASKIKARTTIVQDSSHWTTFGILMAFCGLINAGMLAAIEYVIVNELHDIERVGATIMVAVLLGPVTLLQFSTGLLCLIARPIALARTTAIISMLPLGPSILLSFPTGLWAFLWLRRTPPESSVSVVQAEKPESVPSKNWGATTIMFMRESKWSSIVAILNIAALFLFVGAMVVYKRGYYPSEMQYRIVNADVDAAEFSNALNARLGAHGSFFSSSSDRVQVRIMGYERELVEQLLAIEGQVELVWILAEAGEVGLTESGASGQSVVEEFDRALPVSPGLPLDSGLSHPGRIGQAVHVTDKTFALMPGDVSKLTSQQATELSLEFTAAGREKVMGSTPPDKQCGGLGLVVDGMLEGFAAKESISSKLAKFTLASPSEASAEAIIAAIRGPAIPSDLELIE